MRPDMFHDLGRFIFKRQTGKTRCATALLSISPNCRCYNVWWHSEAPPRSFDGGGGDSGASNLRTPNPKSSSDFVHFISKILDNLKPFMYSKISKFSKKNSKIWVKSLRPNIISARPLLPREVCPDLVAEWRAGHFGLLACPCVCGLSLVSGVFFMSKMKLLFHSDENTSMHRSWILPLPLC